MSDEQQYVYIPITWARCQPCDPKVGQVFHTLADAFAYFRIRQADYVQSTEPVWSHSYRSSYGEYQACWVYTDDDRNYWITRRVLEPSHVRTFPPSDEGVVQRIAREHMQRRKHAERVGAVERWENERVAMEHLHGELSREARVALSIDPTPDTDYGRGYQDGMIYLATRLGMILEADSE